MDILYLIFGMWAMLASVAWVFLLCIVPNEYLVYHSQTYLLTGGAEDFDFNTMAYCRVNRVLFITRLPSYWRSLDALLERRRSRAHAEAGYVSAVDAEQNHHHHHHHHHHHRHDQNVPGHSLQHIDEGDGSADEASVDFDRSGDQSLSLIHI